MEGKFSFWYTEYSYYWETLYYGDLVFWSRGCRKKIQSFINLSKKSTRVCTGILLVPVSIGQPDSQNLCETEEKSYASNKSEHHSRIFFYYRCTWLTLVTSKTIRGAGFIRIKKSESTTIQISLKICSCTFSVIPSHL